MYGEGIVSFIPECLRESTCPDLRGAKDESPCDPLSVKNRAESWEFFVLLSPSVLLSNGFDGDFVPIDKYSERILHVMMGEPDDLIRHCCRKQCRLVWARDPFENQPYIIDESHVQHSISFIQDDESYSV